MGLNVSLWAVDGANLTPLPGFAKLDFSRERNAVGSITVDYPASAPGFDLLRVGVDDDRDVEVEIWLGGSSDGALRGLLEQSSGDDMDARAVWTFSGAFLERLLAQAIVYPQPEPAEKGELAFAGHNAGQIMATVVDQAQARGGLAGVTRDWTTSVDSSGLAWPQTVAGLKFSPKTSILAIAQKLVDLDLAEFEITRDRVLHLWAPGQRGVDRSVGNDRALFRYGRTVGAPIRHTVRDSATTVLVAGSDGVYRDASDATALARRGRRIEVGLDANNLADAGAVQAYATQVLGTVTPGQNEIRHGLTFGPGDPRPGDGFDLADKVVSERAGGARIAVDLQQYTLAVTPDGVTGEVVLNDLIASRMERLRRQLDAIGSGAAVVGTSQPPDPAPDVLAPSAPDVGSFVIDSFAYQETDLVGAPSYAAVTLGWAPVITNSDGSPTDDVSGYRVRYRYPLINYVGDLGSGAYPDPPWFEPTPPDGTAGTSYTWAGVEAGVQIQVQVLAFDRSGNRSAWSGSISHVTAVDTTPPPAPSAPGLSVWFRTLDIAWDGLDDAGAEMIAAAGDLAVVEVWLSQGASPTLPAGASTPTAFDAAVTTPQHVANLAGPSTWNQPGIQHGVGWYAVLRAVDRAGNVSDPSDVAGPATAEQLVSQDVMDQIITAAKLADGAVLSPKIAAEAVTTPHLSVATFSDNMLPNGGFEDLSLTDALPASWLVSTSSGGTNTFTRTTTAADVFSGAAAAQVAMSAASGRIDLTSDTIPTKPGDNWYFELSAKASRALSGFTVYVGVGDFDSTAPYPAGYAYAFLSSLTPLTTAYPGAPLGVNYTVPATVGSGVVPKYLRMYLRFGDVAGDAGAVTFFVDEVRARKVVGTAEIQDAAISRAKIANLAVNSAKIEELQAGLITTGTLVATVTLSGIIRTASSGLRWEGDPSGIRFYNSAGTLTIRLEGATGNTLITGTMQSALTGERWVMLPDGTLRLYPPAGTNYSVFSNFGSEVVWRGPLNGSNRSGRVNVSAIGVGLNFSAESEIPSNLRGEIAVFENEAKIVATNIRIRADDRYSGSPSIMFATTVTGIPEVGGSQLQYIYDTSAAGGEGPRLRAPGINSALKFRPEVLLVQNASGSYRPINASAFNVSSSRLLKRDIRDLLDTVAGLRTKMTRVKPRLYRRSDEVETRPERPPGKIPKVRLDAEGQPVLDETGRPIEDMVDGEWAYDPIPAPERIGFLAEELAAEFPQLVTGDLSDPESVTVDMMGVLAVLWRRVQDMDRPGLLG